MNVIKTNIELEIKLEELFDGVKELSIYVEDLKERLEESESENRKLILEICKLETRLDFEEQGHSFYSRKYKELLLRDKNRKYRVYSS